MNALEGLLRPFVSVINRQIAMTTPAREMCAQLAGKVIAFDARNPALSMYLEIRDTAIALTSEYPGEPDAIISGSLISLMSLMSDESAIRGGDVELRGDAELAQSFRQLMHLARPDLEEELSQIIGDGPAHRFAEVARRVGAWAQDARSTMRQNISEYLQEESRTVPSRNEVMSFQQKLDTLRDDVARFDARLSQIESRRGGD